MFIYRLKIKGDYPPTLWNHVFQMISLESFNELYSFLRFPLKPTNNLQQIAKDFVIAVTKEGGLKIPFEASQDLLSIEADASIRHQNLFDKTFELLKHEGGAEEIHNWAIRTQDFHDFKDRDNLYAWCRLMRECAVMQVQTEDNVSLTGLTDKQAKQIVDYWMARWGGRFPRIPNVRPPLLEPKKLHKLYSIILLHDVEKLKLESTLEQIPVGRNWDTLVLDGFFSRAWVKIEADFRISLDEWTAITGQLSSKDIQIIEDWGLSYAHDYRDLMLPIPSFDV